MGLAMRAACGGARGKLWGEIVTMGRCFTFACLKQKRTIRGALVFGAERINSAKKR